MNAWKSATVLGALLLALPLNARSLLSYLFPRDVHVVINTDVTKAGADLELPTAEKPVYYLAVSVGYRDFANPIAGEKMPERQSVLDLVTRTLHSQGYRLATNKNPPTLIIAYGWGTLHTRSFSSDGALTGTWVGNEHHILRFLGAYKQDLAYAPAFRENSLAPGLFLKDSNSLLRDSMGKDDYYVVALTAYNVDAAYENRAEPLWRTRIACTSLGHYLPEALPTMMSIGAPHIGRSTPAPVVIDVGAHYKPQIEVGDPEVIEEDVQATETP